MQSKNWIGGEWITPSGKEVTVKNPSRLTEEIGVLHLSDRSHVLEAQQAARSAQKSWAAQTGAIRGEILFQMASALEKHADDLASLASREMGKQIVEMRGEVMRGVNLLRYYAGEGMRANGNLIPAADTNVLQYSRRVPLGVVAVITPWNFPVAIPIWKIAPALICGNSVIWKPAENGSLTATRLAEIFAETKLPAGVLNLVIGKGREIGNVLTDEADIDAVSFTGSSETGKQIAVACAGRNIKYQTEMGGKNAAVILADADLDKTVPILLSGAFRSAGQKCTATSRIIVEKAIYQPLVERLQTAMASCRVGEASDPAAYLGPVASAAQYETVNKYVSLASEQARLVAESPAVDAADQGYFIRPMIVEGVSADHALVQEEVFGPLAVMLAADNFDQAIELCNQTVYGLSASLFTRDLASAHRFLDLAQAGMVRVNQETAGVEYQAPFGGMKLSSSHTREQGQVALDFYSEIKTCAIKYAW
ncbi:putative aldehyde dehydrogenase YcbD [Brevibacillus reuszeri]|uniref:Aldehyde dehydrogenase n=1 Tax=Brevibacillus reuszeri TaxID=54915 RepID=A0A0K9YJF9_9BACL|nr:aldehyde dehydrogenase family protein [Brevibacillus reuszeri]KNB68838.1 aldehyde dehydrogenase [Brevibacillus reuszeri]MED1859146.1 aldehyde dehydrogenase family protein [Brevibacillus reuszeri]GED69365.1 putative aldehyde dehydrogenase YcbD [Brevibacillus reuszeri]